MLNESFSEMVMSHEITSKREEVESDYRSYES